MSDTTPISGSAARFAERESGSISVVAITTGTAKDEEQGLLGWLTLEIGLLRVHGVTLRRTRSGRLSLGFPLNDEPGDRVQRLQFTFGNIF